MNLYTKEVEENFRKFDLSSFATLTQNRATLEASSAQYLASYRRVTSLQAWRTLLLQAIMPDDALAFFLEAQGDALSSHVLARAGIWRSALQSLRSCIENALTSVYYAEHPVELRLWSKGQHRLGFSELMTYFEKHPELDALAARVTGLDVLRAEYAMLSRAVHASAASFRMSTAGKPGLWSADAPRLGSWATRERNTVVALNQFLLAMFRGHLQGAKNAPLREALGSVLPKKKVDETKKLLKVTVG